MGAELNWIAIILAAASTMVVGSLWYGPLFGKAWQKLAKIKPDPDFGGKKAARLYIGAFLTSVVTAIVLAFAAFTAYQVFGGNYLVTTLTTGIILSLGFTAARVKMHDAFEQRRRKLTLLTVMHELVTIIVMSIIIGVWPA